MRRIQDELGRRVTVVVRPGKLPTHDDPGGRRWCYLTPDGVKLDDPAFLYHYPPESRGRLIFGLTGWRAEVCGWGPGNTIEGYQTRPRVQKWAEAKLAEFGIEVIDINEARRRKSGGGRV
jgi:hypothetical protein